MGNIEIRLKDGKLMMIKLSGQLKIARKKGYVYTRDGDGEELIEATWED